MECVKWNIKVECGTNKTDHVPPYIREGGTKAFVRIKLPLVKGKGN